VRVGLKDVATLAGVSVKTVSNVVNDYPFISAPTRERVKAAISTLNYRPNLSARQLRTGRSGLIALSLPDIQSPYFAELASLMVQEAQPYGWMVLIDETGGDRQHERRVAAGIRDNLIDGSIASPLSMTTADVAVLGPAHPIVLLGERLEAGPVDHIAVNSISAARDATNHLIDLGRRRIAAIGSIEGQVGTAAVRLEGYCLALREAGRRVERRLIQPGNGFRRADGYTSTMALLEQTKHPDAIFCFNDLMALGALRAIHERGLSVPDDIAVIGFDDIDAGLYSSPTLSTIAPDKAYIVTRTMSLMSRRLDGDPDWTPQEYETPYTLIARESTVGADRIGNAHVLQSGLP
jgi:DNA-binding LacI/PurR family transcriptional regulator